MNLDNLECPICLEKIISKDYYILSDCLHKYHKSCMDEWFFLKKDTQLLCPECNIKNNYLIPVKKKILNKTYKLDKYSNDLKLKINKKQNMKESNLYTCKCNIQ